jgi:hypothetical protein
VDYTTSNKGKQHMRGLEEIKAANRNPRRDARRHLTDAGREMDPLRGRQPLDSEDIALANAAAVLDPAHVR